MQLNAQETNPPKQFARAIEDNSFFIEESYNQEERVCLSIFQIYITDLILQKILCIHLHRNGQYIL